jgi:hypothetical protein
MTESQQIAQREELLLFFQKMVKRRSRLLEIQENGSEKYTQICELSEYVKSLDSISADEKIRVANEVQVATDNLIGQEKVEDIIAQQASSFYMVSDGMEKDEVITAEENIAIKKAFVDCEYDYQLPRKQIMTSDVDTSDVDSIVNIFDTIIKALEDAIVKIDTALERVKTILSYQDRELVMTGKKTKPSEEVAKGNTRKAEKDVQLKKQADEVSPAAEKKDDEVLSPTLRTPHGAAYREGKPKEDPSVIKTEDAPVSFDIFNPPSTKSGDLFGEPTVEDESKAVGIKR